MTAKNKCPVCEQTFATEIAMRAHFNDKHRRTQAQAVDGDTGPDSMLAHGAVPKLRCGNCRFIGRANNIYVCRLNPGVPGMAPGPGGAMVPVTFYPPVFKNDWCGRHEPGAWEAEPSISSGI